MILSKMKQSQIGVKIILEIFRNKFYVPNMKVILKIITVWQGRVVP